MSLTQGEPNTGPATNQNSVTNNSADLDVNTGEGLIADTLANRSGPSGYSTYDSSVSGGAYDPMDPQNMAAQAWSDINKFINENYGDYLNDIQAQRDQYGRHKDTLRGTMQTGQGAALTNYLNETARQRQRDKLTLDQQMRERGGGGTAVDTQARMLNLRAGETTQGASDVAGAESEKAFNQLMGIYAQEQSSLGIQGDALQGLGGALAQQGNQAQFAQQLQEIIAGRVSEEELRRFEAKLGLFEGALSAIGGAAAAHLGKTPTP